MKKYTARNDKTNLILFSEDNSELGRIIEEIKVFSIRYALILHSKKYNIKNVGFLGNDAEFMDFEKVVYFTDLAKERIIKSGENVKIYHFKLGRINQLFEKGRLIVEIRTHKKWFKDSFFSIEAEDSAEDLLILLFLHYSTREFNGIGGDA
ncbi:hypothetical protein HNP38_001068 [Chryseobacterium defluvii]|uniref:Uncharacterized protein n=1 Tax=Chryseobacterium defluvii TaxID=160396 RepID=A0A840K9A0_9FLAO|nr:hypothetical protein [Chryseobacterium defluvii]MBB4805796.1 hypothetical protein [Chryseobacterium defluvii]